MEFYASCPQGFESALADELRDLGLPRVRKLKGRVSFAGTPEDAERACLWSRLASRIFVVLKRFTCRDADELYDEVYTMPWEDILRRGSTIAITASGTNGNLRNTRFTALRAKDALCDRLADEVGVRADVDTGHPDARISIALHDDRASLQLDLSGEPLFRRLPREIGRQGGSLALRPDYAALVLAQATWKTRCDADDALVLIDPCCADGGILLAAAVFAGLSWVNGSVNMSVADYGRSMLLYLPVGGLGSLLVMELSLFLEKHTGLLAKACGFLGRHTLPVLCLHLFVYSLLGMALGLLGL